MRVLSTLPGIPIFSSGVGSGDDLQVKVRETPDNGWFSQVKSGWFYLGVQEFYLFASGGTYTFTDTSTGSIKTVSTSNFIIDPTTKGPVILNRTGQLTNLQRVSSGLRAYRLLSFTTSGDPLVATIPDSGLLVSLVSDPVTGILLSVPSTGDIISSEDYYYNRAQGEVYIRATNPPSIFATYVVDEFDPDLLKLEEIQRVGIDGNVRTQFTNVFYSTATGSVALNPIISKPTPNGLVSSNGVVVSGNVVSPGSSGIFVGDIVGVQYYVNDSYTVVPSGNVLAVNYLLGASGDFTLKYELGNTYYDTSITSGTADYIQLNPIFEPRKSGFLYIVDESEPYPLPATLTIAASNLNPLYNPNGCAGVIIAVNVYDTELESLPNQHIIISSANSTASGFLSLVGSITDPSSGITNGIGQVLYTFTLQGSGVVNITANVSGFLTTSGSLTFMVRDTRYYDLLSELELGKLLIEMDSTPYIGTFYKVSAFYCYRDGVMFAPSGQIETYSTAITFDCNSSQFYDLDGLPLAKPYTTKTDDDGIASILISPVPGDVIRCFANTPIEGRIRTANAVFIPKAQAETL